MIKQQSAGHNHNGNSYRLFFTSALLSLEMNSYGFMALHVFLYHDHYAPHFHFKIDLVKKRQARTGKRAFTTSIRMNVLSSLFIGKKLDWTEE